MDLITIMLIAVGLAMDCFAVSIAQGLDTDVRDRKNQPKMFLMATLFGVFQGGMPLIGYFGGNLCADFFKVYAPWIALVILVFIGGKMIIEAATEKDNGEVHHSNWSLPYLLLMAVATSIDALATGVVFIPYPDYLWIGVGIIAIVSFMFSVLGCFIASDNFKSKHINPGLIGGIILILIGLKIWVEGFFLS